VSGTLSIKSKGAVKVNIRLRVKNLIKRHDTTSPTLLAKREKIEIIYFDLPLAIRGFLLKALRRKTIFINQNLNELQQRIVLCHELGHAKLHSSYGFYIRGDTTYYKNNSKEHEANEYALNLLSASNDIDMHTANKMLSNLKTEPKLVHIFLTELTEHPFY
jgi:Zn-dependent peptidase ImmA (M78 family)